MDERANASSSSVTCSSKERRAGERLPSPAGGEKVEGVYSCLPCVEDVCNVFFCIGSAFEREPGTECPKLVFCCPTLRSSCPNLGQSGNFVSQIGTERG